MTDLIDRQAAIDAINRALDRETVVSRWVREVAVDAVKVLPTAQPSATDTNVGDMISRQAAVRWVKTECNPYGKPTLDFESGKKVIEHLEQMPSAQPKQKPGKWIYGEDEYGIDGYHCDECGFFVPWDYAHKFINYIEDYNFCPHCGADMREVSDGQRVNNGSPCGDQEDSKGRGQEGDFGHIHGEAGKMDKG